MLVQLPRIVPPGGAPVNIPGPGPVEPDSQRAPPRAPEGELIAMSETKPMPPPLPRRETAPQLPPRPSMSQAEDAEDNGSDQEQEKNKANDPYSNLDSAFSGYLADAPQPMAAGGHRGGRDDDLLF